MEFSVYILYSESADKYYVGYTSDVNRRLNEHNNPKDNSKFTAKYLPWELKAFFPFFDNRSEAMKIERFIKRQKSRKFIEQLILEKDSVEKVKSILRL